MQHSILTRSTPSHVALWARYFLAGSVLLLVTLLSLIDSSSLNRHEITNFITQYHHIIGVAIDKIVHFCMYFAVCSTLWIALPPRINKLPSSIWAFLFASLWGFIMEVLQGILTSLDLITRAFDLADAFANMIGAAAAAMFATIFNRLRILLKNPSSSHHF